MLAKPPADRDGFIAHSLGAFQIFAGGSPFFDGDCRARIAGRSFDRGLHPLGFMRQSVAMLADGSRTGRLAGVRIPTLVLHGLRDTLSAPEHGQAIADSIAGAECILIPDWGHGLEYPRIWAEMVGYIRDFSTAR